MAWYYHKADQCGRLARDATDPIVRANHLEIELLWRKIAKTESKWRKSTILRHRHLFHQPKDRLH